MKEKELENLEEKNLKEINKKKIPRIFECL